MDTKCYKCGHTYTLGEDYEIDTWNVGHYGCTSANAPRRFKGYIDRGCPKCAEREHEANILRQADKINKRNGTTTDPYYNLQTQYYKCVPIRLINRSYTGKKAMRFMLGNPIHNQNIWIPCCYLLGDGTLKSNINIDFVFKQAIQQKKFEYAELPTDAFI